GSIQPQNGVPVNATTDGRSVTYGAGTDTTRTYASVEIKFNTDGGSLYGGKDAVAATLLHELGHAYKALAEAGQYVGTSAIRSDNKKDDPNYPQQSRDNADLIQKHCF